MRIRQLIYRALRIDSTVYWVVTLAFAAVAVIAGIFIPDNPTLQTFVFVGICWAALPIAFLLL